MATTINHSFGNTFNVFDFVNQRRIGQVSLMSEGWAAYGATSTGHITIKRIGTYEDAELAIRAVDQNHKDRRRR
jgi:hypothetical protein